MIEICDLPINLYCIVWETHIIILDFVKPHLCGLNPPKLYDIIPKLLDDRDLSMGAASVSPYLTVFTLNRPYRHGIRYTGILERNNSRD